MLAYMAMTVYNITFREVENLSFFMIITLKNIPYFKKVSRKLEKVSRKTKKSIP